MFFSSFEQNWCCRRSIGASNVPILADGMKKLTICGYVVFAGHDMDGNPKV
jgi:hypothetical protein